MAVRLLAIFVLIGLMPAVASAEGDGAYEQWLELLELAPDRQVGLPGNNAVDRLIADRFGRAVAENNDPQRWAEVQRLLAAVGEAESRLWAAKRRREQLIQEDAVVRSALWVRYTIEHPWPVVLMMLVLGITILATWYFQKRQSLLFAALFCGAVAVILPVPPTSP